MMQQPMNPMMMKLMQMMAMQQPQFDPRDMDPAYNDYDDTGSDMDLESRFGPEPDPNPWMNDKIWRGPAPMDDTNPYMQDESHMGIPGGSSENEMSPEPGLALPQGGSRLANYGPIGQRMERMRPTLVHDRKKVQGMFPKGIPEDVEGATREMEGAPDEMSQIGAHKKQHKFMKGHLKAGIGRIQAERSGESVDQMFQKLQGDLQKLKEQRAKRGK